MAFKDNTLTFSNTKIVDDVLGVEVMMTWEAPIMEKSAEFICQSKGDILEIGFGMGICSDYIQAQGVNSHTIVEIHPQMIERLKTWASGKSNVTIVEGCWYDDRASLGAYDGIFLDTFGDTQTEHFKTVALSKAKSGAKITYWNNIEGENNRYNFDTVSYDQISVTPASNDYTKIENTYYLPKVEL